MIFRILLPYHLILVRSASWVTLLIDRQQLECFLIVYFLTNESDIHYHAIYKGSEQNNNISINVTGLIGTEYGISVFALENGLPFPRVVASPRTAILAASSDKGLQIHAY